MSQKNLKLYETGVIDNDNGNCPPCALLNYEATQPFDYNSHTSLDESNTDQEDVEIIFEKKDDLKNSQDLASHSSEITKHNASIMTKHKRAYCDDEDYVDREFKKRKNAIDNKQNQEFILKIYEIFSDNISQLTAENQKLMYDLKKSNENVSQLQNQLNQLTKSFQMSQSLLIGFEERMLAVENASKNGVLLWKITDFTNKLSEAKSGRQPSIYSTPFYSHENGYKLCARVYLNGDGAGRNTHLSIFIALMRGPYDMLLKWPFNKRIAFFLFDQSANDKKEVFIDAFKPDPTSKSFIQPTNEMNIASGIPLFMQLKNILSNQNHCFLKDDTLYIKIVVSD